MAMSFGNRAAGEAVNAMNSILGAPTADNTMLTRAGRMAQDLQERTKYTTDSQEEIEKEKADTNAKLIGMAADHASAVQGINQNAAGITGLLDAGTSLLGTFGGDIFGGGGAGVAPIGLESPVPASAYNGNMTFGGKSPSEILTGPAIDFGFGR